MVFNPFLCLLIEISKGDLINLYFDKRLKRGRGRGFFSLGKGVFCEKAEWEDQIFSGSQTSPS